MDACLECQRLFSVHIQIVTKIGPGPWVETARTFLGRKTVCSIALISQNKNKGFFHHVCRHSFNYKRQRIREGGRKAGLDKSIDNASFYVNRF